MTSGVGYARKKGNALRRGYNEIPGAAPGLYRASQTEIRNPFTAALPLLCLQQRFLQHFRNHLLQNQSSVALFAAVSVAFSAAFSASLSAAPSTITAVTSSRDIAFS